MPVGQKFVAVVQAGLLVHPVDLVTTPVGEVHQFRRTYLHQSRSLVVEARIVVGNCKVMLGCLAQFIARSYSAGNHRIRIHSPLIASLNLWWRKGVGKVCRGILRADAMAGSISTTRIQPAHAGDAP